MVRPLSLHPFCALPGGRSSARNTLRRSGGLSAYGGIPCLDEALLVARSACSSR